jgi:hypothetical protein
MNKNIPKLVKDDPWLEPYAEIISGRIAEADKKETELTGNQSLSDFATGYLFFGLHKIENEWIIREWLPNATHIYLIGTFNDWQEKKEYEFKFSGNGVWELKLAETALTTVICMHFRCIGQSILVNGFRRGQPAWCRIHQPTFLTHRFGLPKIRINGEIRIFSETMNPC